MLGTQFDQQLGEFDLGFGRRTERQSTRGGLLDGGHDVWIGMTEDQRPPGTDVVEIALAIRIPDTGALSHG